MVDSSHRNWKMPTLPKSETSKSVLLSRYLSVAWSNGCVHLQYFLRADPSPGGRRFDPPSMHAFCIESEQCSTGDQTLFNHDYMVEQT
jgi:hypothetical protein